MFNHTHVPETKALVRFSTQVLVWVVLAVVGAFGIALILAIERISIPLWLVILAPPLAILSELVLLLHFFGL